MYEGHLTPPSNCTVKRKTREREIVCVCERESEREREMEKGGDKVPQCKMIFLI